MNTRTDRRDTWVRIRGLSFARADVRIFDGLDMDIEDGRITAMLGPSGSGKTTLLKLIGGQLVPETGLIEVGGKVVHTLNRTDLFELRRSMGMLFQTGALLTDLDVFDNVAFPLREHTELPEPLIRQLVLLRLESVGLRSARHLLPSELSGGMARRVALARALVLDPRMILFDEPFTGQDPISKGVLVKLIRSVNEALGITGVVVSHDVRETLSIADYVYVIGQGRVVGQGTPAAVWRSSSSWIRQFVEGLPDGPVPFHYPGMDLAEDLFGVAP